MTKASFNVENNDTQSTLFLCDDWELGTTPDIDAIQNSIPTDTKKLIINTEKLGQWDSSLAVATLQIRPGVQMRLS